MTLLDGKALFNKIKKNLFSEVNSLLEKGARSPHLVAVLVGDDPASQTYVNAKVKACEEIGFQSTVIRYSADVQEKELISKIHELNNDDKVDGLIVQLPLPNHIDEMKVTQAINPEKDVDGFHPQNIGRMVLNLPTYLPATPAGILELLDRYDIETTGKNCVVIGRSHIVGSPISILMARNSTPGNCTVTLTHSKSNNLKEITKNADILIVALGVAEFITANMLKKGVCIIDVGITRVKSDKTRSGWKLLGDVNFEQVKDKCSYITPVPGGVGPMTIAMLLRNTLKSAKKQVY